MNEAKAAMKRVFFLSSQPLFGQGLVSLLRKDGRFDIVGRETDVELAIQEIKALRPDVVIVDNADVACEPMPAVMRVLREGLGIKVIGLNLQNNALCIYQGEERVVRDVDDLVKAMEQGGL